VAKIIGGQTPD